MHVLTREVPDLPPVTRGVAPFDTARLDILLE